MRYVRRAALILVTLLALGALLNCSGNTGDEPTPEEIVDRMQMMARSKLVCVKNESREPIRLKLYDSGTGNRFQTIAVLPLGTAREWVRRWHFDGHTSVGVDPTGGSETYPDGLRRMLTNPNGYPLALEIGALRGGNEPFAHSYRLAECP